jgi:transaldolase
MTSTALKDLAANGVSVWLDDLSRERLTSGNLQQLVDEKGVVGVTTNPSIFQAALSKGSAYDEQVRQLAADGKSVDEAVFALTTQDVRDACDLFLPVYEATGGQDGRVSIEVDPRLAHDTAATVEEAKALVAAVDRPNVLIKIPATLEGLPAITEVMGAGISVNVTLIFALDRYRAVMNAFLAGLEKARESDADLSGIRSVASFFVSRVDTEVDARLDELGTDEAKALRGKAGEVTGDTVTPYYAEAAEVLDSLERLGISYSEVTAKLEREGVDKFEKSWTELLDGVRSELEKAA